MSLAERRNFAVAGELVCEPGERMRRRLAASGNGPNTLVHSSLAAPIHAEHMPACPVGDVHRTILATNLAFASMRLRISFWGSTLNSELNAGVPGQRIGYLRSRPWWIGTTDMPRAYVAVFDRQGCFFGPVASSQCCLPTAIW